MASLNLNFTTCSSKAKEFFDPSLTIEEALKNVALEKAMSGAKQYPNDVVIGADTIVVVDKMILGKPESKEDAKRMLKMLSGRVHHVYTGVAIVYKEEIDVFYEVTEVTFYELEDEMIDAYIATKEPMDKAGSYGIQAKGALLVKEIRGDYFNIVGLPIGELSRQLKKFGVDLN